MDLNCVHLFISCTVFQNIFPLCFDASRRMLFYHTPFLLDTNLMDMREASERARNRNKWRMIVAQF